jgi:hypothetical protein
LADGFRIVRIIDEKARQHIGIDGIHAAGFRSIDAGSNALNFLGLPLLGALTIPAQAAMEAGLTGRATTKRTPSGSSTMLICEPAINPSRRRMPAGSTICPLLETVMVVMAGPLVLMLAGIIAG